MTYLRIYNIAIEINNWIGFTIKTNILLNFELCHIKFNSYSKNLKEIKTFVLFFTMKYFEINC